MRAIACPRVGDATLVHTTLWFNHDVCPTRGAQHHQIAYPSGRAGDGPAPAA